MPDQSIYETPLHNSVLQDLKKFSKSNMALLFLGLLEKINIDKEKKEHLNFIFDVWQF